MQSVKAAAWSMATAQRGLKISPRLKSLHSISILKIVNMAARVVRIACPSGVKAVAFGALLSGEGKVWYSKVALEQASDNNLDNMEISLYYR
ncbi:MAG: hypothetical protein JST01_20975 [Cyanobacteria bacterium SZAS TMP-1]|nr:hypothetical protein [Cyanobacteria bacterium SZAS TMP-1]